MNAKDLKKYIYENEQIEFVLENIGCHSIQYHAHYKKPYFSCANFDGDNPTAINVSDNAYLNVRNWTRPDDFPYPSDIIRLVQYNKELSLRDAIEYLHSILGLPYAYSKKDIVKMKAKSDAEIDVRKSVEEIKLKPLDESILKKYAVELHYDWMMAGITDDTRDKFGIRYSHKYDRIIIPHRHWQTGELVGLNMRAMSPYWEMLGEPKYCITPGYRKAYNIYGVWENRKSIEKARCVVVVEGEKSVLRHDSWRDSTLVALSGKSISEEQQRILLSLDVDEIVIALDKDVSLREVRFMCEKLWKDRKVSYIWDKWNILGEKDSPGDAQYKNYSILFNNRVSYDETEHRAFLEEEERIKEQRSKAG